MSESLSAYARQFLEMMQKPDVDQIDGLSPAISIEQKTTSQKSALDRRHGHRNSRLHAPALGARRRPLFASDGAADREPDRLADGRSRARLPEGSRLYLLAPVVRGRKGEYRKEIAEYTKKASSASRSTAPIYEIADVPALDKKLKHDIDVVVDRIVVRPDMSARLADSFETALDLSGGLAVVEFADAPEGEASPSLPSRRDASTHYAPRTFLSSKFACPVSGFTIPEIEPRLFSFNNPFGACPVCGGIGHEQKVDADLVVPNPRLTLRKGAIAPWAKSTSPYYRRRSKRSASITSFGSSPWETLSDKAKTSFSTARARRNSLLL